MLSIRDQKDLGGDKGSWAGHLSVSPTPRAAYLREHVRTHTHSHTHTLVHRAPQVQLRTLPWVLLLAQSLPWTPSPLAALPGGGLTRGSVQILGFTAWVQSRVLSLAG